LNAETINHRAKLLMSRMIARRLRRDPALMDAARSRLATERHGYIDEWQAVLDGGRTAVERILVGRTERAEVMRSCSPFAMAVDFTDLELRRRIWRKARLMEAPITGAGAD
jgi:hypothetical protein